MGYNCVMAYCCCLEAILAGCKYVLTTRRSQYLLGHSLRLRAGVQLTFSWSVVPLQSSSYSIVLDFDILLMLSTAAVVLVAVVLQPYFRMNQALEVQIYVIGAALGAT